MKYKPVVARPYLCVCALLEMIIRAEHENGPDQIEIAEYLGIHVPPGHKFPEISNIHYTTDSSKWGVIVDSLEINNLFYDYSIPLKENFLAINLFEDWSFEDKIENLLSEKAHILCGYSTRSLQSHTKSAGQSNLGHAVAILDIKPSSGLEKDLTIYDPGPDGHGVHQIRSWHLFAAIRERKDGLWAISRRQT